MSKKKKYYESTLTPQTRLSDLVSKKYHHQLKLMIDELRQLTTIGKDTEWWRVKRLEFKELRNTNNYRPIARFVKYVTQNESKELKCSNDVFFYYIASSDHSNLNIKWKSLKSLVYSMIAHKYV